MGRELLQIFWEQIIKKLFVLVFKQTVFQRLTEVRDISLDKYINNYKRKYIGYIKPCPFREFKAFARIGLF